MAGRSILGRNPVDLRRQIGYVPQDGGLMPHWTVGRNVALVPVLQSWEAARLRQRTTRVLELVGLDPELFANRYPNELSGGQRQRVAIARALAADPEVILLDEPFGALDAITRHDLQAEFVNLKDQLGKTALLVTHDLAEAFRLADRIWRDALGSRFADRHTRPDDGLAQRPLRRRPTRKRGASLGRPVLALWLLASALPLIPCQGQETVVVGSKNFEENRLLAEIFAQLLESRTDLHVERRFGLAGTQICFEALRSGAIDIYPEYTGTGLVSLLEEEPPGDAAATFLHVRRQFLEYWNLWWLDPLGFENAYELAVRGDLARQKSLGSISDLARVSSSLEAGLGFEFIERDDGLPGLADAYGLEFKSVRPLQQALKYQAAAADEIQVLDVYTTDGRLDLYDLTVLEDDLGFFPPYEAAPLARVDTIESHPEIAITLGLLAGALDEETMRRLNLRLQEQAETEAVVATDALIELGLLEASQRPDSQTQSETLWRFMWQSRRRLGRQTARHLMLTLGALLAGIAVAVPLGLWLERRRALAEPVIRAVGLIQTVPSIALLAFMIPLLGVGVAPALVALWIYSLFPILRNTFTGVRDAAPNAVEAGTALGMTDGQILRQIRLPLAAPVIMAGIRTAAVITIGTATLAAFIGAGGLGEPIVTGLQLANTRMILSGALPAAALALLVDFVLARVEQRLEPLGLD